jgi:negative regulator of sigma E activity
MMAPRGFAIVLLATLMAPVSAKDVGMDLMVEMTDALHRLNYSGTLVHIKGADLNTLRISHEYIDGVENEVISSLNESQESVSRQTQPFSLSQVPDSIEVMDKVYSLDVGAFKKVADRKCQIVIARPKDKMRYLQKYCIDSLTKLPLAYSLIDNNHNVVEQFTFTSVEISEPNPDQLQKAYASVASAAPQTLLGSLQPSGDWTVEKLPKGFTFGKVRASAQVGQKTDNTEHFVVTDGLSSVSVFISPITTAQPENMSGISSGALNVLTSQKNNHRITLVGEVPKGTMQRIFTGLHYRGVN